MYCSVNKIKFMCDDFSPILLVTCKSGGSTYAVGDSFNAPDGCNTW